MKQPDAIGGHNLNLELHFLIVAPSVLAANFAIQQTAQIVRLEYRQE
jgi:hypothetical protein